MPQKAICPRGHVWDPSTLAGLPATDTPHCPICGEVESARKSQAVRRLSRWCRANPLLAALSAACLLLAVALAVAVGGWVSRARESREALEQALQEADRIQKDSRSRPQEGEKTERLAQQAKMEAANWRQKFDALKNQLRDADTARRDALRQRDEQVKARNAAEDLAQTAEQVRQEAVDLRRQAARQLIGTNVATGTQLMDKGDLSASLLWFAEALRLAQREKMPEEIHRLRLAAILARCARPVLMWMHDRKRKEVHLSADGRRMLAIGADGSVQLLDALTGERIGDPLPHDSQVTLAAISDDGKRALTADVDMMVHVWDLNRSKERYEGLQRKGRLVGLDFSPDGKRFLSVGYQSDKPNADVELLIWDTASGDAITEQPLGSELSPRPAAFSPDGAHVLTICRDNTARLWDIATGKQIGSSFAHKEEVVSATFSTDGRRVLTTSGDGTARVWNAQSGEPVTPALKHGATVRGGCLSPAGRFALTWGEDRRLRVWNAASGEAMGPDLLHPDDIHRAIFSPDERFVLTICADGAARLWNYLTGEEAVPALGHAEPIWFAAFDSTGSGVVTLSGKVMRTWDLTAGEPPAPPTAQSEADVQVFSPDGHRVLRATGTTAQVYDTATNKPIGAAMPHANKVSSAAFSGDGRRVLTVMHQANGDQQEGHVRVWETESGKPIGEALVHPRSVHEASLNGDGRRVLTACQDQKARLWDADKGELIGVPMDHNYKDIAHALFTPGDRLILTVTTEGAMRLWGTSKAERVGNIWGHKKAVRHLEFSPDGRRIATASEDGTAVVWETESGNEVAATPGHGAPVVWVAFSPDGKRLATASENRQACVWDAHTGKPIASPIAHRAAVTSAGFSANGRWLLTIAADGVHLWSAATGEPVCPPIKYGSQQSSIRSASLSRDGQLILAAGTPGDPSSNWLRDLRADDRPVDDLLRLAELLTGRHPSGDGQMTPLTDADWGKEWNQLREKYAKELAIHPASAAAWHLRGAAECEQRQLWQGALRHLDRLIAVSGASAELNARRTRVNAELHRPIPGKQEPGKKSGRKPRPRRPGG